jgi:hypothetical protein
MKQLHLIFSTILVLSTSVTFAQIAPPPNLNPAPTLANKLTFANASAKYATPAATPAATAKSGASTAMRAYINPDTGALTQPTQLHLLEDAKRAKSDTAKSTGAAVHSMAPLSSGGMRAKVSESASSQMVASVGADGALSISCQEDHSAADHVKGKAQSAPHRHSVSTVAKGISHVK